MNDRFKVPASWPVQDPKRYKPLDWFVPYERNARTHPTDQIALLAQLIAKHGPDQDIVVDENRIILKGHGRATAAKQAGLTHFTFTQRFGLSEAEKAAIRIQDNQVALLGGWDTKLIVGEISMLRTEGFDIGLLGFPETQLRAFGVTIGTESETDPEEVPEPPKVATSKRGDVWMLGDHRLMCGDSTSADDVAKVLAGAKPRLMVTDPPYGVNYDPKWRDDLGIDWTGQAQRRSTHPTAKPLKSRSLGKVSNDHLADWTPAWKLFTGDIAYVWHGGLHAGVVQANLEASGLKVRAQIIWRKQHFVFSRGDYHWQHEPCWYAVREGRPGQWAGDRKQTTVWDIANASAFHGQKDDDVTGHGTQKPVECMKRPLENNSKKGDAVYEPFSGSFTTGIACETTGRRCFAIELDPVYVDVGVLRWQKFSSREATLAEDGRTFAQVQSERSDKTKGTRPSRIRSRSGRRVADQAAR